MNVPQNDVVFKNQGVLTIHVVILEIFDIRSLNFYCP